MIYVKNPKLKKRVFKSMNRYDNMALKNYKLGKRRLGEKYENKSDKLYKKFYSKMFGVKR